MICGLIPARGINCRRRERVGNLAELAIPEAILRLRLSPTLAKTLLPPGQS
jgi:hypothetical protein